MFKKKILDLAAMLSQNSEKRQKMGAVIAKKNKVISWGVNSSKTHPTQNFYNQKFRFVDKLGEPGTDVSSIHAEMDALNRCKDKDLKGHTLYVYRQDKNGKLRISRPCKACYQAIVDRGIKKIVYTTENGIATEMIL